MPLRGASTQSRWVAETARTPIAARQIRVNRASDRLFRHADRRPGSPGTPEASIPTLVRAYSNPNRSTWLESRRPTWRAEHVVRFPGAGAPVRPIPFRVPLFEPPHGIFFRSRSRSTRGSAGHRFRADDWHSICGTLRAAAIVRTPASGVRKQNQKSPQIGLLRALDYHYDGVSALIGSSREVAVR